MKKILENLALIELNNFCEAQGINASGSRVQYAGRFKYDLVTVNGGELLASVQFHKSQVPTHYKPLRDDLTSASAKPAGTQGEHTPGPWRFNGQTVFDSCGEEEICTAGKVMHPEHAANARLIAAAPELLAALNVALNRLNCANASRLKKEGTFMVSDIEAAIAKATGQ